ncbi:type 1 glutamine amidotransferase [Streptomyces radicis]|uniref:Type 1 glutamine amidotransferase n=1 Tax=Streptomyces radicis TaxID=1750517 RepID=A0A3A9WGU4_9ACTN|nr:type 1 glutamine amidotransferase [Streptomyces radicis]RKN12019.1 type 1 glutamine amidotransferase [Streptomyces radicis]RKN25930.1 type 1 glutamine amidotransferase [Streptomyces radicis]
MAHTTETLVVQHTPGGGPGRWGAWLAEGGLDLRVVRPYAGEPLPDRLEHAALLVLGGAYLPDDDARAPWLATARGLVRDALDREIPMVGICLGGQMLATVAGGAVQPEYGEPEFGSTRLTLRAEAADDPLFHGLPAHPPAIENHVDAIVRLPEGARWLARSERCPYQAFRVGTAAWGVQFHPESSPERIALWSAERLERHGVDREELRRRAAADEAALTEVWREVALRFAALARNRG